MCGTTFSKICIHLAPVHLG